MTHEEKVADIVNAITNRARMLKKAIESVYGDPAVEEANKIIQDGRE